MTVVLISSLCTVWNPLIGMSLLKSLSPSQRLRALSISASLTHILLLHHPETVTHNLRDLSAPCSSFERSWNKLISPHLLRTSVLRFLHSNLLIVDVTCWHDYVGNAILMWTTTHSNRLIPCRRTAPFIGGGARWGMSER